MNLDQAPLCTVWRVSRVQVPVHAVAIHRESGGWRLAAVTLLYQRALAFGAAFVTYRVVSAWL